MGGSHSKKSKRTMARSQSESALNYPRGDNIRVVSQSSYDEEAIRKLKRELQETPQVFVLNNLLMSIMFFENYEKEKQELIHSTRTPMEKELNPILLKNETIECIIPDVIFDKVNKNVRFRPLHGPGKQTSEPLVPKRIFVVNDNIEVTESMDDPHYTVIDKPSYQVQVEDSERDGFVKLKHIETQTKRSSDAEDQIDQEKATPGSSTPDDSDASYEYTTITQVRTPQPLNIISCERRDTLPQTCFTTRKIKKYEEEASDSEDEDEEPVQKDEEDLYETISYISSKGFMVHFQNAVFPNSLGKALGFDLCEISLAKAIPGTIFCNPVDKDSNLLLCEIIPSVGIQWPNQQTYEFFLRDERPTLIDKAGNRYRWPIDDMIMDMKSFKCVLVPKGYFQKRGENVDSEIEWEISFPKAERYLDTRMSHAQMRCLLYILTLFKSYIEPVTKKHGLLVEHIRHHMYWELESNYRDWPEHKLGTKLLMVLESLNARLSQSHLSDFFIKRKNVFENIPNKYLKEAQKILHYVLESPAIYFIGALRNLRYTSGKFYPPLNFKKLYTILTTEGIDSVNRNLKDEMYRPPNIRPKKRQTVEGDTNFAKEIGWRQKKERINRERFLRKQREEKEKEENLNAQRKGSVDSVDFQWECEKQFDVFKSREILIFFSKHFIEMGRKSRKLSAQRQSLLYLKQAYYLTKILEQTPGFLIDAIELLETISKEEEASKKMAATESFDQMPPSTPKRNSAQFNWDMTQQVNTNNINLNNLNKAFFNTAPSTSFNKIKKFPSNVKNRTSVVKNGVSEGRKSVGFSPTVETC